MKVVYQSERSECGLACIAIVASHHGKNLPLTSLRRAYGSSNKGSRLNDLIDILEKLDFIARPLRADLPDLGKLHLPCILHWEFNHFVVLKQAGRRTATILDPAIGERRVSSDELSKSFTGVALEVEPSPQFQRNSERSDNLIFRLLSSSQGITRCGLQIISLSIAIQLFTLVAPFFLQWTIDQVLTSADRYLLGTLTIGFCLLVIIQSFVAWIRGWSIARLSAQLGHHWMSGIVSHVLRLPLDFLQKRNLGDVTSRIESVNVIQRALTVNFVEALLDGIMTAATLALMAAYSLKLTVITLVATAVYFIVRWVSHRQLREATSRKLIRGAEQHSHMLESIRGLQTIKLSKHESARMSRFSNLLGATINEDLRISRIGLTITSTNQVTFGIERVSVIAIGASLVLSGVFSAGMLMAYLAYKEIFTQRAASLVDKWYEFKVLMLHGERLEDIVTSSERSEEATGLQLEGPPSVQFDNVSFRYSESDPWILHNCSFSVLPGESVAIIGASGSGKTTLLKLMIGLLRPCSGRIIIDGRIFGTSSFSTVSSSIGSVMQDDQLFSGSIFDNISMFQPDASVESVHEAAALAQIHEDILEMPMTYHTLIGDMGNALSGGQKQRILVARSLFRHPKLLALDEATSHLDVANESLMNKAIVSLPITRIIIAHRPETIASADRVICISDTQGKRPSEAQEESTSQVVATA